MELQLKPETESRLHELVTKTGRPTNDLVEDAMAGYLKELAGVRTMLDSRYDDVKSGRVQPIDGEEAFARLRRKGEERRNRAS
jgi:predicted DNA-binding protein